MQQNSCASWPGQFVFVMSCGIFDDCHVFRYIGRLSQILLVDLAEVVCTQD
jgi:hypothetical protein